MLSSIRKFSNSIFAKIFLFIVAIPFVFWGMGDLFRVGNQNTIFKIGKDKVSKQEFIEFININFSQDLILNDSTIDKLLANFIGEKLIEKEIESFKIVVSDESLGKIIKNQDLFKRDNIFSRTEYEKFLVNNNLSASYFEKNLTKRENKKQMLDFISSGITSSNFLANINFNKTNQERKLRLLNIDDIFANDMSISEKDINNYFQKNKEKFEEVYKSIKFIELNSKNLIGDDEFTDLFFKKIDEIDDLIVEGKDFDYIKNNFNLPNVKNIILNEKGKTKNSEIIKDFPKNLTNNVFNLNEEESISLIESENKYFLIELTKTETIYKKINSESVRKDIKKSIKKKFKREKIFELISKINSNTFNLSEFKKLSNEKKIPIKKITVNNINDNTSLKKELVNQIYQFPKKKVVIVSDINLDETYLIYIDEIKNVQIDENSDEYEKYSNLSKTEIINSIYSTYDRYLKNKYEVKINYNALDSVKNNIK